MSLSLRLESLQRQTLETGGTRLGGLLFGTIDLRPSDPAADELPPGMPDETGVDSVLRSRCPVVEPADDFAAPVCARIKGSPNGILLEMAEMVRFGGEEAKRFLQRDLPSVLDQLCLHEELTDRLFSSLVRMYYAAGANISALVGAFEFFRKPPLHDLTTERQIALLTAAAETSFIRPEELVGAVCQWATQDKDSSCGPSNDRIYSAWLVLATGWQHWGPDAKRVAERMLEFRPMLRRDDGSYPESMWIAYQPGSVALRLIEEGVAVAEIFGPFAAQEYVANVRRWDEEFDGRNKEGVVRLVGLAFRVKQEPLVSSLVRELVMFFGFERVIGHMHFIASGLERFSNGLSGLAKELPELEIRARLIPLQVDQVKNTALNYILVALHVDPCNPLNPFQITEVEFYKMWEDHFLDLQEPNQEGTLKPFAAPGTVHTFRIKVPRPDGTLQQAPRKIQRQRGDQSVGTASEELIPINWEQLKRVCRRPTPRLLENSFKMMVGLTNPSPFDPTITKDAQGMFALLVRGFKALEKSLALLEDGAQVQEILSVSGSPAVLFLPRDFSADAFSAKETLRDALRKGGKALTRLAVPFLPDALDHKLAAPPRDHASLRHRYDFYRSLERFLGDTAVLALYNQGLGRPTVELFKSFTPLVAIRRELNKIVPRSDDLEEVEVHLVVGKTVIDRYYSVLAQSCLHRGFENELKNQLFLSIRIVFCSLRRVWSALSPDRARPPAEIAGNWLSMKHRLLIKPKLVSLGGGPKTDYVPPVAMKTFIEESVMGFEKLAARAKLPDDVYTVLGDPSTGDPWKNEWRVAQDPDVIEALRQLGSNVIRLADQDHVFFPRWEYRFGKARYVSRLKSKKNVLRPQ